MSHTLRMSSIARLAIAPFALCLIVGGFRVLVVGILVVGIIKSSSRCGAYNRKCQARQHRCSSVHRSPSIAPRRDPPLTRRGRQAR